MECVLGIVDEGTTLGALVATIGGEVVGAAQLPGPSNVRFVGEPGLRHKLEALIGQAFLGLPDPVCLSAAAALHVDAERGRSLLAELVPLDRERAFGVTLERAALCGSLGTPDPARAVAVRADVGSRAWGVGAAGHEAARGGFGEVLGDDGSAYWIGRQGIRAALRAFEKRHRNTLLKTRLLGHFGLASADELLAPEHQPAVLDRYEIASFAPQVFEAADQDDEVAIEILEEAGRDLAVMTLAVVNELELAEAPFSVLPWGSVFRSRGATLEAFMKTLRNKTTKASLVKEGMGAAAGAVLLAIRELGLKVRPDAVELLRSSLRARG